MNIKLTITPPINEIEDPRAFIGAIAHISIPGISGISGEIIEIATDDGTIVDCESIIIKRAGIKDESIHTERSIDRGRIASRGCFIQHEAT